MDKILFFIVGSLLTLIFTKKPFQIKIEHVHNYVKEQDQLIDMEALEQEMLKKDPTKDAQYENFNNDMKQLDEVLQEVNEIMGGSDRV